MLLNPRLHDHTSLIYDRDLLAGSMEEDATSTQYRLPLSAVEPDYWSGLNRQEVHRVLTYGLERAS